MIMSYVIINLKDKMISLTHGPERSKGIRASFFHGPREDSHNLKYWMASFTAENYNPGEEHKD